MQNGQSHPSAQGLAGQQGKLQYTLPGLGMYDTIGNSADSFNGVQQQGISNRPAYVESPGLAHKKGLAQYMNPNIAANPQMDMMRNRTSSTPYNVQNPDMDKKFGFGFDKNMQLAGAGMQGLGMLMNYQAMRKTGKQNDQKIAMMQKQQGLAEDAYAINRSNQQSMARQMA
jgi:hypothetical protein